MSTGHNKVYAVCECKCQEETLTRASIEHMTDLRVNHYKWCNDVTEPKQSFYDMAPYSYYQNLSSGIISNPIDAHATELSVNLRAFTPMPAAGSIMYKTKRDFIIGDKISLEMQQRPTGKVKVYVVENHEPGETPLELETDCVFQGEANVTAWESGSVAVEIPITKYVYGYMLIVFEFDGSYKWREAQVIGVAERWAFLKYGDAIVYPKLDLDDTMAEHADGSVGVAGGLKHLKMSQAEYTALAVKDENTIYYVYDQSQNYTMYIGAVAL